MSPRRIAALLEVLGVFIAGQYLAALFSSALNLQIENPLLHLNPSMTNAELLFAARDMFFLLSMQYAGWFALMVPINWWYRRSNRKAYGLTRAGKSWTVLLAAGLAAAALSAWPGVGMQYLDSLYHLGQAPQWSLAIAEMDWHRWEFWLLTAVMSWAFVASMEELFFRGYCQRRLAEDWGDGPAILGVAALYAFSRTQYLIANRYNIAVLASLFVLAIGFGVVFAWTRSLVPAVLAHTIFNFPMTASWRAFAFVVLLAGAALFSRRGWAVVKRVFAGVSLFPCLLLAASSGLYAAYSEGDSAAIYMAACMLGLAVGLEAMQRGIERDPESVPKFIK